MIDNDEFISAFDLNSRCYHQTVIDDANAYQRTEQQTENFFRFKSQMIQRVLF